MEIKNFEKGIKRIKKAIKKQENIFLLSDNDLDGVVSLIILEETLKILGTKVVTRYFRTENQKKYGLTLENLKSFEKYKPGLLILMDCGMSSFEEIKKAKIKGFETIIIDHHIPLSQIPPAKVIINPKQKNDQYPFKFLASAGLCFKLSQKLLENKIDELTQKRFLELATLATLADKVPLKKDNKLLVDQGLTSLSSTSQLALKCFFKKFKPQSFQKIIQEIIWALNITDQNYLPESYKLLTCVRKKKIEQLFNSILKKSQQRQKKIEELVFIIEKKISPNSLFIFEEIDFSDLAGAVASWLTTKLKIPAFIFCSQGNKIKGSVRSPQEINIYQILTKCQFCLDGYGGHRVAAGFNLKKKNLQKFKHCIFQQLKR